MSTDLALLILRVTVGLYLIGHGTQKLFGWFGGPGFKNAQKMFGGHMRLRPALFWTLMAGLSEAGGGLLLALGLFSPLGSLGIIAAMFMAVKMHWPKFWAQKGGIEFPLLLLVAALSLGISGPGSYSLDNLIGLQLPEPLSLIVGLVAVMAGVVVALATRRPLEENLAPASNHQTPSAAH